MSEITTGSFVSWPEGKGRVDLVVTKGVTIPGIMGGTEGPAARVVVWDGDRPTALKVAVPLDALKPIAPLDGPEEKDDPARALMVLGMNHSQYAEEMRLPPSADVTSIAMKAAYDRGLADWPGPADTTLSPVEWALGRAAHLCKAAIGEVDDTNDADLLNPAHPLAVKRAEETGTTVIDAEQVQADLDTIMADAEV